MAALRQVGENFSRLAASRFGLLAKAKVTLQLGEVAQVGWEDFEAATAGYGVLVTFNLGEGQVFAHLPAALVMALVDLYLAGPGTGPFPERSLSETESRLLSPFLTVLAEALADAASSVFGEARSGPVTQMTATSGLFLSNRRMPCAALSTSVLLPSTKEPAGALRLCFPVSTLRPLLAGLQASSSVTGTRTAALAAARRVPLTLSLRYASVAVPLRVAERLSPGQVLSLGHPLGEPLLLCVGDKPLFTAVPIERARRAACQIVGLYEPLEKGNN